MERVQCLALIICDLVLEDKRSSNRSLIGLFNTVLSESFPLTKHLFVFLSLTGMRELVPLVLRVTGPSGVVIELRIDPAGAPPVEPDNVHDLTLDLPALKLPTPGRYRVELLHNDMLLAARSFEAVQTTPAAGTVAKG